MQPKNKTAIKMAIIGAIATITIYNEIGDDYWDETLNTSLDLFAKKMDEAKAAGVSLVNVRINSNGGDVHQGLGIANLIQQSEIPVHTYNDGICYSMAGIILLSGHKVFAAENSKLMIHAAGMGAWGNAAEHEQTAKVLRGYDSTVANFIASKTGEPLEDVLAAYFDGQDHYFSSKEAIEKGMIDEVTPGPTVMQKIAAMFTGKKVGLPTPPATVEAIEAKETPIEEREIEADTKRIAADLAAEIVLLKEQIQALKAAPASEPTAIAGQSIEATGAAKDYSLIIDNLPHNRAADKFFK